MSEGISMCISSMALQFQRMWNHLQDLLKKIPISEPHSRTYDSPGLGHGPGICRNCISSKFSGCCWSGQHLLRTSGLEKLKKGHVVNPILLGSK